MKKFLNKSVILFIIIAIFFSCINLNTFVYADKVDLSQYESWKDIPLERFQNPESLEEAEALSKFLEGVNYADLTEEERMEHQKEIAEVLLKMKPIQKEGEEK